jgi:fluoride ion exporter CrcB/FEX
MDSACRVIWSQCNFWFTAECFAVGLFAFGGVGLRVAISNALVGRIESSLTSHTDPFLQAFYAQPYLASNMLGSFIMAFCIAFLNDISAVSAPVYKGLTTGFCGSLTTLSSWMNSGFYMLFDKSWYELFIMVFLEFYLTWSAFTMGFATARLVKELTSQPVKSNGLSNGAADANAPTTAPTERHNLELPKLGRLESASEPGRDVQDPQQGNGVVDAEMSSTLIQAGGDTTFVDEAAVEEGVVDGAAHTNDTTTTNVDPSTSCTRFASRIGQYEYYIWAGSFCITAVAIWVVLGLLPQLAYYDDATFRDTYRSVALAPFGAWLRWALTRIPTIKQLWPQMNPQTLIANLSAVTLMCALLVFSDSSWVAAVNAGFNGSLSTVSTFMAELHVLYVEDGAWVSLR